MSFAAVCIAVSTVHRGGYITPLAIPPLCGATSKGALRTRKEAFQPEGKPFAQPSGNKLSRLISGVMIVLITVRTVARLGNGQKYDVRCSEERLRHGCARVLLETHSDFFVPAAECIEWWLSRLQSRRVSNLAQWMSRRRVVFQWDDAGEVSFSWQKSVHLTEAFHYSERHTVVKQLRVFARCQSNTGD